MKKFLSVLIAAAFMAVPVMADVSVSVDGQNVSYSDQTPVIINDRTYIPIRDVFEKMGFKVDWDGESKAVTISDDYYIIVLMTGTDGMLTAGADLNYTYKKLENTIQIVNGRTMLPLREILESAGYELGWDAETKTAIVANKNDYSKLKIIKADTEKVFSGGNEADYEKLLSEKLENKTEQEQRYCLGVATIISHLDTTDGAAALNELSCPRNLQSKDKELRELFVALNNDSMAYAVFKGKNPDAVNQNHMVSLMFDEAVQRTKTKAWEILENL